MRAQLPHDRILGTGHPREATMTRYRPSYVRSAPALAALAAVIQAALRMAVPAPVRAQPAVTRAAALAPGSMQSGAHIPESAYRAMRWRLVGPFRGGRALAIEGIAGDPATFYFGAVGGGVWRTRDAGTTWEPLTNDQPFASIGALAIAPSDPHVLYVGSGEADMRSDITYGQGMWKSTDAGAHWESLGLTDTRQIGRILIDPRDPNVVLVAALGHAYGPNADRGVYRSTDGGRTWQKVLYRDEHTGAIDLAFDPTDPRVVFATLWQAQRTPWSQYPPNEGPGSGLFKSTDEGQTWTEIVGHGLPPGQLGRVGLAVARGSAGRIVYALCSEARQSPGLYRTDDAGETWHLTGADRRIGRGWYFGQVFVDPTNVDVVYVPDQSILRSSDGGRTFTAVKGAPGGDDYHSVWVDPTNAQHIAFASDQGVGVSLDAGMTWSSWYNQPTAQFYHVITDTRWPYWIYGAQQDAGAIAIVSRSDFGEITFRDWFPPGAGESGYIAPDPRDSTIIYGGGPYGDLLRFDRTTGQLQDIRPWPRGAFGQPMPERKYRFTWTSPLVFDPVDKRTLYFGSQVLLRTSDGGMHWDEASPDLTGAEPSVEHAGGAPTLADASAKGWGVIYTIAPSPVREGVVWVGTDNGKIQLTTDRGSNWRDATPQGLAPWSKISLIDASRLDSGAAYAAVDRHRLDDVAPYIYRTHDFGRHWSRADRGIPAGAYVRAVRADPVRRGLLFAGTELGVYVSFDDGDQWQPLQLNLPVSPVHDLVVHNADLVVATHGRAFWVLDDITPLRQVTPAALTARAHLARPTAAVRQRQSENHETPFPPEISHGTNPPTGAIIDYWLADGPSTPAAIDILDARGAVVRHFASNEPTDTLRALAPSEPPYFMSRWLPRPESLTVEAGHNRFVWDLRLARPPAESYGFSSAVVPEQGTEAEPAGPLVTPGQYQVRLTVGGVSETQSLRVVADPREHLGPSVFATQLAFAVQVWNVLADADALARAARVVRDSLTARRHAGFSGTAPDAAASLERGLDSLHADALVEALGSLETGIEGADRLPTAAMRSVFAGLQTEVAAARAQWAAVGRSELATLNVQIRATGGRPIEAPRAEVRHLVVPAVTPDAVGAQGP
jgi:photosystem II stability/assembly factor-like uncharacterized protein